LKVAIEAMRLPAVSRNKALHAGPKHGPRVSWPRRRYSIAVTIQLPSWERSNVVVDSSVVIVALSVS
jgi:hypothetical protein